VAAELALSVVLLIGAGLMVKSFVRLTAWPAGFAPDRVLTMRVQFSGPRYRDARNRIAYVDEMLARARTAPGVEAAGVSSNGDCRRCRRPAVREPRRGARGRDLLGLRARAAVRPDAGAANVRRSGGRRARDSHARRRHRPDAANLRRQAAGGDARRLDRVAAV